MAYHKKPRNEDDDLEDLLRKADQVLGETPPEEAEEDAPPAPWEDLRFYANYSNHYGQDVRNYQNNYGRPNEPRPEARRKPPGLPFQPTTWIFKTRTAVSPGASPLVKTTGRPTRRERTFPAVRLPAGSPSRQSAGKSAVA